MVSVYKYRGRHVNAAIGNARGRRGKSVLRAEAQEEDAEEEEEKGREKKARPLSFLVAAFRKAEAISYGDGR